METSHRLRLAVHCSLLAACCFPFAILAPSIAAQDSFTMRNGRIVEGRLTRVTEDKVFIEISLEKEGSKGGTSIPISEIAKARLKPPDAIEIARAFLAQENGKGAVQILEPMVREHLPLIATTETWVADAVLLLSEALLQSGNARRSSELAATVVQRGWNSDLKGRAQMVKLRACMAGNHFSDAEAEAERILAESQDVAAKAEAGFYRAKARAMVGKKEEALEDFMRMAVLRPQLKPWASASLLEAARLEFGRGDLKHAAALIHELLAEESLDPSLAKEVSALIKEWKLPPFKPEIIPEKLDFTGTTR